MTGEAWVKRWKIKQMITGGQVTRDDDVLTERMTRDEPRQVTRNR